MKPKEDAFGQSLWAYHNSNESFQIIERDDGYIDYMDTKAYFAFMKNGLHMKEKH